MSATSAFSRHGVSWKSAQVADGRAMAQRPRGQGDRIGRSNTFPEPEDARVIILEPSPRIAHRG
eukprot:4655602-Prymnesium_polylepis.1